MATNIFWSYSRLGPLQDILDIFWESPTSLLSEVKEEVRLNKLPNSERCENYLSCPVLVKQMNDTYVIKSPINFSFTWTGKNIHTPSEYTKEFVDRIINVRDINTGVISLNFRIIFFADQAVNTTLTGPYFSNNVFANNVRMFPGSFDISKWFRPLDVTFQVKSPNTTINIKKGDHLMYLQFNTNDKYQIKKFDMVPDIDNIAFQCMRVKDVMPKKPMDFLYNLFTTKSGFNKKVLKLINKNICE